MKLRSISLSNVRRFAGQLAVISGIGDGISVIAQPNEFGKSTFFDALQAVFFTTYSSKNREIQSLQPQPAGGKVEIAVDIELPHGRFRIEKRFLSKPMARVTDLDRGAIVAQDDGAEHWIKALTDQGLSGPAGLLWVRQGVTRLESDDKGENAKALTERRNLLSAVAGEIDLMTGGRRMDRVRDRATQELTRLASASGRPKAGGPWKDAKDEVDRLTALFASLGTTCREFSDALTRRREIEARLAALEQPEARTRRVAALKAAEMTLAAAQAHAAKLAEARQSAEIARLRQADHARRLAALDGSIRLTGKTRLALETVQGVENTVALRLAQATEAEALATSVLQTQSERVRDLRDKLARLRKQAAAREARERLTQLADRLTQAESHRTRIEAIEASLAANRVTQDRVAVIDKAVLSLSEARLIASAQAVSVTLHYDGDAQVLRDGVPVPPGETLLDGPMDLTLPGIGRMVIDPGSAAKGADRMTLTRAESALVRALAAASVGHPDAAHAALRARQEAEQEARLAQGLLKSLAPEGLAALRLLWTRTQDAADTGLADLADLADPALTESDLAQSEAAEAEARLKADAARAAVSALAAERAGARMGLSAAITAHAEAEAAAGDPATRAARLALSQTDAAQSGADLHAVESALAALAADAPDLATAQAELSRAKGAVTETEKEIERLRVDRARLEGEIGKQADLGVEERLAEAEGALVTATEREARYGAEVAALAHLLSVLDETRTAAREAYFGPVQRELQPLLTILADNAALTFDDDSLLPGVLARQGGAEPVETLSGGTQEQIAILTRLAFARLFAKAGRPVPVILDDALVHTDDDRIRRMFTALHRVAVDQQVIVFTCRQLAFQDLGGARPDITVATQG